MTLPDKKFCVVSGASGDVGQATCKLLLDSGYRVLGFYRSNPDSLDEFSRYGDAFMPVQCDFRDPDETRAVMDAALADRNAIDALICCAGMTVRKPAMITSDTDIANLMTVNVLSVISLTKAILRRMIVRKTGSIVYIGSRAGTHGLAGQAAYSATKGAIASYALSLAQEVGPIGVTVNVIAPGAVANEINPAYSEAENAAVCDRIALKRLAGASEIAELAHFLVSVKARYITGAVIPVDGGARF